jgi:hypothetical protein
VPVVDTSYVPTMSGAGSLPVGAYDTRAFPAVRAGAVSAIVTVDE